MKTKIVTVMLAVILAFSVFIIPAGAADYNARSYILMEASTGTVLLEHNADEALPPASVTKIMTVLLVMEAIADGRIKAEDTVRTSEYAASMGGSQVFLSPGEEMTVYEMLKCVLVASANDAAGALAEAVAGSEEAFVALMNQRAAELGMKNTVFKNTNGLDDDVEGHVTSARDIAIMSRELITKHPMTTELSSIWMDSIRDGSFGLTNTNRLIRFYRGANGLKTGSTARAGFCISATAERDGMQLIAVVMASPTRDERNDIAKKLLDHGFSGWELALTAPTEPLAELRVLGGKEKTVPLYTENASALVAKGQSAKITSKIYIPEYISAPITSGEVVGRIDYYVEDEIISSLPVKAAQSVEKLGYTGIFRRLIAKMLLA